MAQAPQPSSIPKAKISLDRAVSQPFLGENSGTEGAPQGHGPPLKINVPHTAVKLLESSVVHQLFVHGVDYHIVHIASGTV